MARRIPEVAGVRRLGPRVQEEPGALPAAACRLLGFARIGDAMRHRVEAIVAGLIRPRRLVRQGDHLVIPDLQGVS
jgi:hypothetical protein